MKISKLNSAFSFLSIVLIPMSILENKIKFNFFK